MQKDLASFVRGRAADHCEYCCMPQVYYPSVPFPIDHIIARQHGGGTSASNLALSCLHCNYHKGPNIAGIDPVTKKMTKLYHPRRHKWERHFLWDGPYLIGKTAIGRATIQVLAMNAPELIQVRELLILDGLFPSRTPPSGGTISS